MKWIRPLLVVILVLAVTVGFFARLINTDAFFGFATGLVVYWFKSRDEEKQK